MNEICCHCLVPVREDEVIRETIDGTERVFCCAGCQGIFHLLHDSGLDEFYERRKGWLAGPPEQVRLSPDLFRDSVVTHNGVDELDLSLSGIRCASCVWLIEKYLMKKKGIVSARVNYATHGARIRWNHDETDIGDVINAIASIGYIPHPRSASAYDDAAKGEKRDLLIRFGTAAFFSMQLMLYTGALYAGYFHGIEPYYKTLFQFIAWGLATPVIFYSGYPFLTRTIHGIKSKTVTMDTLIFLGSFSAYAYSVAMIFTGGEVYFDTSAMIITLILLGRFIESGAKVKATETLASLVSLQPPEARLIQQGGEHDAATGTARLVPAETLIPENIIEVLPGDTLPADCTVIGGTSEVDESMLTGESMTVHKSAGDTVYGGTTNLNGRLLLEVVNTGSHTLLAQIIKTVEEAQQRKAPIQSVADGVVRWFVPSIIFLSLVTFLSWWFMGNALGPALMKAVSVLVIACPCALGLATPLAILRGTMLASAEGILVRGGDILERAAKTEYVAFDKTGTLTIGKPALTQVVPYSVGSEELRRMACALERRSEHVIARAVCEGIQGDDIPVVDHFRAVPGKGVEGMIGGQKAVMGNPGFLRSSDVRIDELQSDDLEQLLEGGSTVVGLATGHALKGWFAVSDIVRGEANGTVTALRKEGYSIQLLTGDHRNTALSVAGQAGIIDDRREDGKVMWELSPLEKAAHIRKITSGGSTVMMVGDGINDAPALTEADVGIAMGRSTDIALQSSDIVLIKNRLDLIPVLLKISKSTLRTIKQNLFWAFSYNIVTVPLAVAGKIHPIVSAALMAASSLIVVANTLRLRR